jgi:glutamate racemase
LKKEAVIFLDSGVGGLPYLRWTRERLQTENWLYLADHQGFPYGDKRPEELIQRLQELIQQVQKEVKVRLLVLACNTASVIALDKLRQTFDFPIVGTVPRRKACGYQNPHKSDRRPGDRAYRRRPISPEADCGPRPRQGRGGHRQQCPGGFYRKPLGF